MAVKNLSNMGISIFCENMAMMLAAGIGPDEAVGLLGGDSDRTGELAPAAEAMQQSMLMGSTFADSVTECGAFPQYVGQMLAAGEQAGRTEQVLRTLAAYYEEQDALQKRLKSAVLYPLALLLMMTAVLVLLVGKLLPVFSGVYRTLAGGLAASSYAYLAVSAAVGWIALAVTAVVAVLLLICCLQARSVAGRQKLHAAAEKIPPAARLSETQSLAAFTHVLSVFVASGLDTDTAVSAATKLVHNKALNEKLDAVASAMEGGMSMAEAFYEKKLYAPLYGRMLLSGARSGHTEQALAHLAEICDAESARRTDAALDGIEPALSLFLTVAVGVTLLAAMLPLIGILGAIG